MLKAQGTKCEFDESFVTLKCLFLCFYVKSTQQLQMFFCNTKTNPVQFILKFSASVTVEKVRSASGFEWSILLTTSDNFFIHERVIISSIQQLQMSAHIPTNFNEANFSFTRKLYNAYHYFLSQALPKVSTLLATNPLKNNKQVLICELWINCKSFSTLLLFYSAITVSGPTKTLGSETVVTVVTVVISWNAINALLKSKPNRSR